MIISIAPSVQSKSWKSKQMSWEELVARLRQCTRTGETMAEYARMSRDDRSRVKDTAGCFVGGRLEGRRRVKDAVLNRCLITLDADNATPDTFDDYCCMYGESVVCYSTHSSTADKPRLRFVLPLSREVSVEEYEAIARRIGARLGMETLDKSTFEPWRAMYWPSVSLDGTNIFREQQGECVDADAVLAEYGGGPAGHEAWRDVSLWPLCPDEIELREREQGEARKAGVPAEKPGMVGLFCSTYDVDSAIAKFLPDVYEDAGKGRYTYSKGSTFGGAVVYGDGSWIYSNHATDPASGMLLNAWDLVRIHMFGSMDEGQEGQDVSRRKSQRAMEELAAADPEVRRMMAEERSRAYSEAVEGLMDEEVSDVGEEDEGSLAWAEGLLLNSKTGECEPCIENALLILRNDPNLRGAVGFNELAGHAAFVRSTPWHKLRDAGKSGDWWRDVDDSYLRAYMEKVWRFVSRDKLQDAWNQVVDENAYHPVRQYLEGLVWDGRERVDTLLVRYFLAEDNEYVRAVTRKWMLGAVKRAMVPGCQFDNMLVLYGRQGIGKSRFGRILSRGWFTDSLGRMDAGRDSFERLNGAWIVEVGELAAAKKSEVEDIKNFITKTTDVYRAAYERQTGERKRQCVFYGSTNTVDMLRDSTGGRRYWIVEVPGIGMGELIGMEEEVDQLWAEAVHYYRAGEDAWLSDKRLSEMAAEIAENHTVQDEALGLLMEYLDRPIPDDWESWTLEDRRSWYDGSCLRTVDKTRLKQRVQVSLAEIRFEFFSEKVGGNDKSRSYYWGDLMSQVKGWKREKKVKRLSIHGVQRVYTREGGA